MKIAGMGSDNLRQIEVDKDFAMRPEALSRQIESDIKAGSDSLLRLRNRGDNIF